MKQNYFFLLLVFCISISSCEGDCQDDINVSRSKQRDSSLFYNWQFLNDNHFQGDSFLIFFDDGDLCSSTKSKECDMGGGAFGTWYTMEDSFLYFTTCSGVNDGIVTQQAQYEISDDTLLKIFNITHLGGIFGRDTNIMKKRID